MDAGLDVIYLEDLTRFVGAPAGSREAAYAHLAETGVTVAGAETLLSHPTTRSRTA
jgi:hypothetical protein